MIQLKTAAELELMANACKVSANSLLEVQKYIVPGISTFELDKVIYDFIIRNGAKPSFLGYDGFPGSACLSINNEVIHGLPSKKKILKDGDILSVDVGAYIGGYHGDNAFTFFVGSFEKVPLAKRMRIKNLLSGTKESLYKGISQAIIGNRIGNISYSIQKKAEERQLSVVKQWVGHGIGKKLHEDPQVPNFGKERDGVRLAKGMTIAIEPMINEFSPDVKMLKDKWTIVTTKGGLSAHFEHTIAVTDGVPIILTDSPLWHEKFDWEMAF